MYTYNHVYIDYDHVRQHLRAKRRSACRPCLVASMLSAAEDTSTRYGTSYYTAVGCEELRLHNVVAKCSLHPRRVAFDLLNYIRSSRKKCALAYIPARHENVAERTTYW